MGLQFVTWLSTCILIVLCELGDKTQMAVLMITSNNPKKRWLVFGASSLALTLCVLLEVTIGATIAKFVGPAIINKITGAIFLLIGAFTLFKHFRLFERIFTKTQKQVITLKTTD